MHPEPDWPSLLRALDEPGELGQSAGLEFPRGFDVTAAQDRFDRLGERLGTAFGMAVTRVRGPQQDAAYFGEVEIPAELTSTRTNRLGVRASNFGDLATCLSFRNGPAIPGTPEPPVHPDDLSRIEPVLTGLGYQFVPPAVLDEPYHGPNEWVFGPRAQSWFTRFFGFL